MTKYWKQTWIKVSFWKSNEKFVLSIGAWVMKVSMKHSWTSSFISGCTKLHQANESRMIAKLYLLLEHVILALRVSPPFASTKLSTILMNVHVNIRQVRPMSAFLTTIALLLLAFNYASKWNRHCWLSILRHTSKCKSLLIRNENVSVSGNFW